METKIIKVKINPDGRTAKEINPFPHYRYAKEGERERIKEKWYEAESKLRTFKIKNIPFEPHFGATYLLKKIIKIGKVYEAEILTNGTIKIL